MSEQISFSQVILGGTTLSFGVPTTAVSGLASLGITAPVANSTSLTLSGGSHTGSDATGDFSFATTLNTTGSPDVFKIAATITAAGASTKLFNLYGGASGTTSRFSVDPSGNTQTATLALGGATVGSNSLAVTGSILFTGTLTVNSGAVQIAAGQFLQSNGDAFFGRRGANSWHLGFADSASPLAQTLGTQDVSAGTSNTAGANWTLAGSKGTGTGAGGQIILQTAPAGATGTAQNAFATGLTITAPAVNMQPSTVLGNQALAANATDGFLYIASGAGQPTGTPTAFTGRVPLYYDTTNHELWIYDGSWLQPKTPAAAAVVTWQ